MAALSGEAHLDRAAVGARGAAKAAPFPVPAASWPVDVATPTRIFLVMSSLITIAAAVVPLIPDEAYYVAWSRRPALGYLDHPPMVALLAASARLDQASPLAARLGTVVAAVLSFLGYLRLCRAAGLSRHETLTVATLLRFATPIGLGTALLVTPDAPLFLGWTWALAEAAVALRGRRRRWLTAGAAAGLALASKYTAVLLGPVFLWGLLRGDRGALRTRWPYLGAATCALVIGPNLAWNARHDWQSFAFQLRHGLSGTHQLAEPATQGLPVAEPPLASGDEHRLTASFPDGWPRDQRGANRHLSVVGALRSLGLLLAGEAALWGAFAPVLVADAWAKRRRTKPAPSGRAPDGVHPRVAPLLVASAAVPLFVFGAASLRSRAELNWPAMYVIGAAVLLAPVLVVRRAALSRAALLHVALAALGLAHVRHPFVPIPVSFDRLLHETHGVEALARRVAALDAPVAASSYQLAALLEFHEPSLEVAQWPGVTRGSELTLRAEHDASLWSSIVANRRFWLVSSHSSIPHIPGAHAIDLVELRDCRRADEEDSLEVRRARDADAVISKPCAPAIHLWYLVEYIVEGYSTKAPERVAAEPDPGRGQ